MISVSYKRWRITRAKALDEIEGAHAAIGGTGLGRRFATQQLNHAYAVMLAAQFQGYCRDLHAECVDHLIRILAPPIAMKLIVESEIQRGRQLDQRNAQPASIGADFGRFGIDIWMNAISQDPRNARWKASLDSLNEWRNAIAHQSFDPARLRGAPVLRLAQVREWHIGEGDFG
jgi:hypothetical protein